MKSGDNKHFEINAVQNKRGCKLENVNEKESIKKVKSLLLKYRRLALVAGADYNAVTNGWNIGEQPKQKQTKKGSLVESQVLRKVEAENELGQINRAIKSLSDDLFKTILWRKYCSKQKVKDIAIYMGLNMSESEFYRLNNRALLEFAYIYNHGALLVEH